MDLLRETKRAEFLCQGDKSRKAKSSVLDPGDRTQLPTVVGRCEVMGVEVLCRL